MENMNQLLQVRREKLQKIMEKGISPYPNKCTRSITINELWKNKDQYENTEQIFQIVGRIGALRRQGKIAFINLEDESGKIQLFIKQDILGEEHYELVKLFDLGDFLQADGEAFITQTGEYSIRVRKISLLSKNLRPLPAVKEKVIDGNTVRYDEFSDIETRYRKRYLDLLLNPDHKKAFTQRAKIISEFRKFMEMRGFLEVETPILQPLYGGANARPFITHHNTLDTDLYLRIATELYLKRLIVGGFERVFEIGKNFRNEGMDRTHNPEFTAFEVYQAFADYHDMMNLTEDIFLHIAGTVFGKDTFVFHDHEVSLAKPWKRASMIELIKEHTDFDCSSFNVDELRAFIKSHKHEYDPQAGPGKLITEIFEMFVEPKLIQPTFVTEFPKEVSPLAKTKPDDKRLVERFELFICGGEYANAFSELNDPLDQRERLEEQARLRESGDLEANVVDEDFLEALEYGMPPTGGLGIGVDRMIMFFTNNVSIKEVILFPQMKPEN